MLILILTSTQVVISQESRMQCRADGMPLLSGGMGALGIVTAQYLAEEGAKTICLLSRGGTPAAECKAQWAWLQSSLVNVKVEKCDVGKVSDVQALKKALGDQKVYQLLHLAGVLADSMLGGLTKDHIARSYGPKVHGLHNLCQLSFEDQAFFLLYSSTSALFGSPGQANYSASNSVLDSQAPIWTAQGEKNSRTVQWGPWAEVGMAVQKNTLTRAKAMGVGALATATGMGNILYIYIYVYT